MYKKYRQQLLLFNCHDCHEHKSLPVLPYFLQIDKKKLKNICNKHVANHNFDQLLFQLSRCRINLSFLTSCRLLKISVTNNISNHLIFDSVLFNPYQSVLAS